MSETETKAGTSQPAEAAAVAESAKSQVQLDAPRLFVALPISLRSVRALRNAASDLQERALVPKALRFVSPARYHITLKYLGYCREEALPAVVGALQRVGQEQAPFELRCQDLGAFPSSKRAEVIWAGVDDAGPVASLAAAVEDALVEVGFPQRNQPFHPHVTLARAEGGMEAVSLIQEAPERLFSKSLMKELILYKSAVVSDASEHPRIATIPLCKLV